LPGPVLQGLRSVKLQVHVLKHISHGGFWDAARGIMLSNETVRARPLAASQLEAQNTTLLRLVCCVQDDARDRQDRLFLSRYCHRLAVLADWYKTVHQNRQARLEDRVLKHLHTGLLGTVLAL